MKLRTRLVLTLLLLAVVPLTVASVLSWWSSERAFRRLIAAEAGAIAEELGGRTGEVMGELSFRLARMQRRRAAARSSPFDDARREALAAAGRVQTREVVRSVLREVPRREGEVPFAVDEAGAVLTASEGGDRGSSKALGVGARFRQGDLAFFARGHVVTVRRDSATGFAFGIARPMGEAATEMRRIAFRNLGLGLALVALASLGILPLSRRISPRPGGPGGRGPSAWPTATWRPA